MTSTTATWKSPVARWSVTNSPGGSATCSTVSPIAVQSAATAAAAANRPGFAPMVGLSSWIDTGSLASGRYHWPPLRVHLAALSASVAFVASNATGGSAAGSNHGEDGG